MLRKLLNKLQLSWYEGAFIGAALLVAFTAYLQYQRINELNTDLQVSEQAIEQAAALYNTNQARQEIDQSVVTTITEEVMNDRYQQRLDRKELIRDYLIFKTSSDTPPAPNTPTPDPTPTTVDQTPPDPAPVPSRVSAAPDTPTTATRSDDTAHFDRLARGMRDTYCRAGGADPACTPEESN